VSASAPASRIEIGVVYFAGIVQGLALVTFPAASSVFTRRSFDWLRPLPVVTGIGLVLGYALLGRQRARGCASTPSRAGALGFEV
jgi:hypothetical protein